MSPLTEKETGRARGRGRPRQFDEAVAIDQAVELFWSRGYRATTMRELEAALEMSQTSIYNAFGSKQELLSLAIDRYEHRIDAELFSILLDASNGLDGIIRFFGALTRWLQETGGRGCLVVNLMAGEVDDEFVLARVRRYRQKIRDAFALALADSTEDPAVLEARASLLLSSAIGLHLAARTATAGEIDEIAEGVCTQVADWR